MQVLLLLVVFAGQSSRTTTSITRAFGKFDPKGKPFLSTAFFVEEEISLSKTSLTPPSQAMSPAITVVVRTKTLPAASVIGWRGASLAWLLRLLLSAGPATAG